METNHLAAHMFASRLHHQAQRVKLRLERTASQNARSGRRRTRIPLRLTFTAIPTTAKCEKEKKEGLMHDV